MREYIEGKCVRCGNFEVIPFSDITICGWCIKALIPHKYHNPDECFGCQKLKGAQYTPN